MRVGAAIEDVGKLGPGAWLEERDYEGQGHRLLRVEGARRQGWRITEEKRGSRKK